MAGHSHWAGIKHKKALVDAKRGKLWSRLSKAIIVAAKMGGGDPDANFRLRTAIEDAKAASVPKDNIARAIKKGTGELAGGNFEEITYEGYGPGGVAILCEVLTDNRNRTAPEVRKCFEMSGGKLGSTGCVAWMFEKRGLLAYPKESVDEDALMEAAIEAGAEDVQDADDVFEVYTAPNDFTQVKETLEAKGFQPAVAEVSMIPQSTVKLTGKEAAQMLRLTEALDELDDLQNSYSNFDISAEELEQLAS